MKTAVDHDKIRGILGRVLGRTVMGEVSANRQPAYSRRVQFLSALLNTNDHQPEGWQQIITEGLAYLQTLRESYKPSVGEWCDD